MNREEQQSKKTNEPVDKSSYKLGHIAVAHKVYKLGQKISCEFCGLKFLTLRWKAIHCNKNHRQEIQNLWPFCLPCDKYFPTSNSLDYHRAQKHRRREVQRAARSKKTKAATKKYHKVYKLGQKISCEFCEQKFSALRWKTIHCNNDHRQEIQKLWPFCLPCNNYFPTSNSLDTHRAQKHPRELSATEVQSKKTNKPDQPVKCQYCIKMFSTAAVVRRHIAQSHVQEMKKDWLTCDHCPTAAPKMFQTARGLCVHITKSHANKNPVDN